MSRNFELLRRAGKAAVPFSQPSSDWLSDNGGRVQSNGEMAEREIVKPEKDGVLRHGPDVSRLTHEEAVKLVQRVFVFPNSHSPRAVVFSSVQGNGSSEICFRAGEVLAAQGSGSVCLVDANLRAPSLHQLLGVGKFPGLADATVKSGPIKEFTVRIASGNLWLLPSGSSAADAQGLFGPDRLRSRIGELRKEFGYVLIDAPAIDSNADAVVLGQMADGVVLVLEANSTRRETARMAKESFESANVKLLGAVLNNRRFPIPEALYRKL
jgi:protein-tyrosine kinase